MNTRLQEIDKEMDLLRTEARAIEKIENSDFIEKQKKYYEDNVAGKVFYGDGTTWHGYEKTIKLYKPIRCEDWSAYNSCVCLKFEIQMDANGNLQKLHSTFDTFRVDSFVTHLTILTLEKLCEIKEYIKFQTETIYTLFV